MISIADSLQRRFPADIAAVFQRLDVFERVLVLRAAVETDPLDVQGPGRPPSDKVEGAVPGRCRIYATG